MGVLICRSRGTNREMDDELQTQSRVFGLGEGHGRWESRKNRGCVAGGKATASVTGEGRASRVRDVDKGPNRAMSGHVPSITSRGNQGHGEVEKDTVET